MKHLDLLKQLIAIRSYSGEEDQIRQFIAAWFKERGINSFTQDKNLTAYLEGKDKSKAFIFNSHMDTVSSGDSKWKYDPWSATEVGDKIVGLGASDMKSGIAASMLLAEQIIKKGVPPVDIWFTYVTKEEIDGFGTQSFAKWFIEKGYLKKYKELAGIFTEPTSLIEIEHGHRGNMFIKAQARGDSGHASRPGLIKKHAVRQIIEFSDVLQSKFKVWSKEFSDGIFEPPTVGELTSIHSGVVPKEVSGKLCIEVESPNRFPSSCVATFDVRTTPDFHKVAFERISEVGKKYGVKIDFAFPPAPAGYTDPNEKIIKIARRIVSGSKLTVSKGSADLGFLSAYGVKAIIFGPGIKDQGHKLNEFAYPDQIPQAVEIYKQIVEAWAK